MFQQLLAEANEISLSNLTGSSRSTYKTNLSVYQSVIEENIGTQAFPIDENKMMAFITYQFNNGRACSTLMNYISAFSNYFRENNLDNLTQSLQFKRFKSGLLHKLKSGHFPYQKEPFNPKWFPQILNLFPISTQDNYRFFLIITLAWHCFLRVSETTNLRFKDLTYDGEKLTVFIRWSKSDQVGNGEYCYVYNSESVSNPIKYLDGIKNFNPEEYISNRSIQSLRSHLKVVLKKIGVTNPECYIFHSLRRGAAYMASENGIQDCVIKKHGRWKSDAYIRYVRVDASRAGMEITKSITI